jgi:hypothetical protein
LIAYKSIISRKRSGVLQIILKEIKIMAKNGEVGDGHRDGQVTGRSQTYNDSIDRWIKRDTETGQFMDQKQNGTPFKGVRKEK